MENNIEMIEKIENMLNTERRNRRGNREIRFEVNSNYYEAVSKLLSDYKRVLKENEELKNDYENLSNSVVVKNYCIKNSIPIQKIKDKIEEYKNEIDKLYNQKVWNEPMDTIYKNRYVNYINILQELLESEE